MLLSLEFHPLAPNRWNDFEELFGPHGASSGCWCMWWRSTHSQFRQRTGAENKRALKEIVDSGALTGLLAYADGRAIAWCSIGPRETYPMLERSRMLKRVDDQPVWAVVCFFVAKFFRGRGVMVPLLEAAVRYAQQHGARIVEGYPVEPEKPLRGCAGYTGVASAFRRVGFEEVARGSQTRPIMRYTIGGGSDD